MNSSVVHSIILLFSLIAIGYIARKTGILDEIANGRFSRFLLNVAMPGTILYSAVSQKALNHSDLLRITLIAVAVFALIPLCSRGVARIFHLESTYQLMLNYSNLGFMGFPLIASVFGNAHVFYAVIFMMVFNVHIFTFGVITLCGKGQDLRSLLKTLCSPGILSAILAFLLVLFPVSVPEPVTTLLSSVNGITTPLAMIVIGSQLGAVSLHQCLKSGKLYLMTFFKLAVYPALVYVLFSLLLGKGDMMVQIAAILTGLPVAGNVTMLCSQYEGDVSLAAQGTCVSTLLSLVTIPVMLSLIL